MKILEFIKRNISVFTILSGFFIILSIIIFVSSLNEPDYHGFARGFSIIILLSGFLFLVLDFILKQFIKDRIFFNLIEGILFIPFIILFFNLFIS